MDGHPRRTVLVVEDEALVRLLVVQILEESGHRVLEAAEGRAALDVLKSSAVDLMITDVGLPGMNGRQLAEQARALKPGLKVLFMTGYADSAVLEDALPDGLDLITKPFDLDHLAHKADVLMAL